MATLAEVKIAKLHEFRKGMLELNKADLTAKAISGYWESNRDKLRPSGIVDNLGRYIRSIQDVDDADALADARDHLIGMVDDTIASLSGAPVPEILQTLILKVADVKLLTLLREFNAIKDQHQNLAAIGLRTIICLIIQEKAKLVQPDGTLANRPALDLGPMIDDALKEKIFDGADTNLLRAFKQQGLKDKFDNVVHKPGEKALIDKADLSALVKNTINSLLAAIV